MTRVVESIWNCPLPVVAAVQGKCVAGGADLLLHCDFVLMAPDAEVGYPPTRFLGTPPSHLWVERLGIDQARRILLTGDVLNAQRAEEIGFAVRSEPSGDLDSRALGFTAKLSEAARELLISNKWLINRSVDLSGRSLLNRIAQTEDALAHTSLASRLFAERAAMTASSLP